MPLPSGNDVLFEFTRIGPIVKVTAVDARTGTEVTIQGPAAYGAASLQRTALAKLRFVLEKNREKQD